MKEVKKCKKCGNDRFLSRYNRITKKRVAWVCSNSKCNTEQLVIEAKINDDLSKITEKKTELVEKIKK